jgi:hypothetical protein
VSGINNLAYTETGLLSRYTEKATVWTVWGSIAGRGKNYIYSTTSRPALGSTLLPIQRVKGAHFLGGKAAGA